MNWKKLMLIALPGLLLGLGGLVFAIYVFTNPRAFFETATEGGLDNFMWILPILIISVVVFTMLMVFVPVLKRLSGDSKQGKMLRERGVKTMARILKVEDTGITMNNVNFYVKITVETTKGNQATFKQFVSRVNVPRPGDMMQIVYDPTDPTKAASAV